MKTKKVKSAGRFGARYGLKLRKRVVNIEKNQRRKQACPYCQRKQVKRLSVGIFECGKCGSKFTGKAYTVK